MSNSPTQIIPDILDWRQIWGSGSPRKVSNSAEIDLPCETERCLVEKWLLGAIAGVATPVVAGCHIVPRINTIGDRVLLAMSPHTITLAVGESMGRCQGQHT
ncbi:hypothetical protein TNCV_888791 [Trichonephila clavipes]|nr:hypothetical protein TNCV_888791 [Trichonephila clavipes]